MTFEGEHRQIVMRGIEHSAANGVSQDGGMNEVVNLLPRNGSYVPYSPKNVLVNFPIIKSDDTSVDDFLESNKLEDARMIRVHHTSTGDNTIIVKNGFFLVVRTVSARRKVVRINYNVYDIVFIGNRMDLECAADIKHLLWKDGEYVNADDLKIHINGDPVLPSVCFKVGRGIYDGKTIHEGARYVKTHKSFTDADTSKLNADVMSDYPRELTNMGGDALALLSSIRYAGGITGYILVAAAWRVKGSDVSNPQYIMASPVMLMGAPEIYLKDDVYWDKANNADVSKPQASYLYDVESLEFNDSQHDKDTFDKLWKIIDTDSRKTDELAEKENVFIEFLESYDSKYHYNRTTLRIDGPTQGDAAAIFSTEKTDILRQPSLFGVKYALYNHGDGMSTIDDSEALYKGVRITYGTGNVLYFKLNSELEERFKDEIDRLCIFVSPVVSPYKYNSESGIRYESNYKGEKMPIVDLVPIAQQYAKYDGFFFGQIISGAAGSTTKVVHSGCAGSFSPIMKSDEEIRNELKNVVGLYKVSEVQLSELSNGADNEGWIKVNLSDGRLTTDRMVQHSDTMLKISDMQPIGFTNGHIFGYNERLHVYNFQKDEVYRLPYKASLYHFGAGQYKCSSLCRRAGQDNPEEINPIFLSSDGYEFSVEVVDSNGSKIVNRFSTGAREGGYAFNPLSVCADIEAKSIRIVKRFKYYSLFFVGVYERNNLSEIGGITCGAFYDGLRPIELIGEEVTEWEYNNAFDSENIKKDSRSYGRNEIHVSYTGLSLFENDKSYKVGHGDIIGLARLSIGLSQDNFGKFPLVVFCTDGIYMLSVDASGAHAYGGQSPLSRVVCTNKNGICEIDGAVLFPAKDGLYIVTSDGAKPVSMQVNGNHYNSPYQHNTNGLVIYSNAIQHEKIVSLYDAVAADDFREFIQDSSTFIRYVSAIHSALVYNKNGRGSYLIDLSTWNAVKLDYCIGMDDNDYPNQIFYWHEYGEDETYRCRFEYESGKENAMCLLTTRPLLLESHMFKTAYRVVLRGTFEYVPEANEAKYAGLYVYGSLDGEHFDFLNGTEKLLTNNRFHDIGVETHHVSYKYLMVVFAGHLSKDSHIDGLELTSSDKYTNKLK